MTKNGLTEISNLLKKMKTNGTDEVGQRFVVKVRKVNHVA